MSEFQPINIADGEEEIIVINKTKKVKNLTKKLAWKNLLFLMD